MKSILIAFVALCFAAPAFAGRIVKDGAGWYCNRTGADPIFYWPAGRVPTTAEQLQCAQLGGTIVKPKAPVPLAPTETK